MVCPLGFGGKSEDETGEEPSASGASGGGCPLGFGAEDKIWKDSRGGRVPGPRSVLDKMQRDAQASELDYTNTSPGAFGVLVLVQCVATYLLSPSPRFALAAAMSIGSHWLGFVVSVVLQTDKYFDITEDIAYFMIICWSFSTIEGPPSLRQQLVYGAAMLWCVRLCAFVGYRVMVRGSDWRFDKLIKSPTYNLFGWTSGGTWCWANGFCLWYLADSPAGVLNPLDSLDCLGLSLFAVGLAIETIADLQKYHFNEQHLSGENSKWIASGLWAESRHPNYCGEITLWAGLAIASVGGFPGLYEEGPSWMLPFVTPVFSCFFLVFTSLMLLEKRADSKWGGLPAYEAYKRNTPVLFPLVS